MKHDGWMRIAIETAKSSLRNGQAPFGACIVDAKGLIVSACNLVWSTGDVTAHAEVTAIREACIRFGASRLIGSTMYSTCEPCPMCFTACHWAGIRAIVYGTSIDDACTAGSKELAIPSTLMKELGGSAIEITGGVLIDENRQLFTSGVRDFISTLTAES